MKTTILILLYGQLVLLLFYKSFTTVNAEHLWTSDFAVEVYKGKESEAEEALHDNGFSIVRKIPDLENVYHVRHDDACSNRRCKREAIDFLENLKSMPYIKRVEQQMLLEQQLRYVEEEEENLDRREYHKRKTDYQQFLQELDKEASDIHLHVGHDDAEDIRKKFEQQDEIYSKSIKERMKANSKITFNDPGWKYQWQLDNHGQLESVEGVDLNLVSAYSKGYRGENSVVTVVDDGIDTKHPELRHNYDPAASLDLNDPSDLTGNPRSPNSTIPADEGHGTLCAGEIAALDNNHLCGVGVAHKAHIGGIRLLAGAVTDLLEAFALSHNNQYIMIYSNSWGPKDDGKTLKITPYYTTLALQRGAEKGRAGRGSIFVFASGNGGRNDDSCGMDGFVNSIFTIAVTAVNHHGITPSYTEKCAALSLSVPVGGYHRTKIRGKHEPNPKVITSNINGGCRSNFMGTSAATPLAAGCIALALEANANLTWRDVQHILYLSCRIPNRDHLVWQRNGAGFPVSHFYGFGLLDCAQLVKVAQNWENVGEQHICRVKPKDFEELEIKARHKTEISFHTNGCQHNHSQRINQLEHVTVSLNISHVRRGDLSIWLISPSGTKAPLLLTRKKDSTNEGLNTTFLSLMMWGERPAGTWVVQIADNGKHDDKGYFDDDRNRGYVKFASLTLYGTYKAGMSSRPKKSKLSAHREYGKAHVMTRKQIAKEYQARRLEFIGDKPLHRKVHEIKSALKERHKGDNLEELRGKVLQLNEDDTVDVKDIQHLENELQKKVDQLLTKQNNNREQLLNERSDYKNSLNEFEIVSKNSKKNEEEILKRYDYDFDDDRDSDIFIE